MSAQSPLRLEWAVVRVVNTVKYALPRYDNVRVDLWRIMVRLGLQYREALAVVNEVANRLESEGYIVKWLQPNERFVVMTLEEG